MDIHIQPKDTLQHLTSAGRFQVIERIRESKIHFSYFWTADNSLHLEVDGFGFKTFPAIATFAKVDEYIQQVKSVQVCVEPGPLAKQAEPESYQDLKCERDELRAEVERLTIENQNLIELVNQASNGVAKLQYATAEVERLKADKARLDWLETTCPAHGLKRWGLCCADPENNIRQAIDAATKGAESNHYENI